MTPKKQELYDRLYVCEISDLELLKETIDVIIFDKFLNDMIRETKQMLNKSIKNCKKLIDMPFNHFNLDNYISIIAKNFKKPLSFIGTPPNTPIKLMSGNHKQAGIIQMGSDDKKITLIGKGVLFDAGGYNLKRQMTDMKSDMAGMATVLAVMNETDKVNISCPVATNLITNNLIIPGDEIKIGKKNVTITDTDAEGRLILAETLATIDQKDNIIVTVATLTGVVGYAVGDRVTGVFTPNDELWNKFKKASDKANELCWRLPLWDYLQKKHFKTNNIKNYVKTKPGASMAALFIQQFIKNPNNWIHLDIAYSAWNTAKEKATGVPVKSLLSFVKGYNG